MSSRINELNDQFAEAPATGTFVQPQGPYSATVAEDATAMDHKVHVVIPHAHPFLQHGAPARWMPRSDAQTMPKRGDWCLVAIDENQEPTILVWWPNGYT